MTDQTLDLQRVFYLFRGRPIWGIRRAPGRLLIAEFGNPSLEYHSFPRRRLVRTAGLYHLELKACDWQIVVYAGSVSSGDPIAANDHELLLDLEGQYFEEVLDVSRNGDEFTLAFDLGGELRISASADASAVQWSMTSAREVQRFRSGGRLSIEERDFGADPWTPVPTMDREERLALKFQWALAGAVGPQLRAVNVTSDESSVHFDCYFDGEISEQDRESMSIVETEILSSYPETHRITHTLHRLDYPAKVPLDKWLVYFRREEGQWLPEGN